MITHLHIPTYPLNECIESFFYYTGFSPDHSVDRFLPDGNVQLIFDLTDTPKCIYDNQYLTEIQTCKSAWFSGFRTMPITIPSGKESEMIVVEFRKGKAFPFLNIPLHKLTNLVVDAEIVLSPEILHIREQLLEINSPNQKLIHLEQQLTHIYTKHMTVNPVVDFIISETIKHPNHLILKELCNNAGYSQKHIIHMFKHQVGVTPKSFLKIIRFQHAIQEIENSTHFNWAALAYDCGFYDQSHFISDFKHYSGFTPKEYLNQKGQTLNYIPLDR